MPSKAYNRGFENLAGTTLKSWPPPFEDRAVSAAGGSPQLDSSAFYSDVTDEQSAPIAPLRSASRGSLPPENLILDDARVSVW